MTKTVGVLLAGLLAFAPGAAAQGALDAGLGASAYAQGQLSGSTDAAQKVVGEVQGLADGALATAGSAKADVKATLDVDARPAVDGATKAGTGFVATARGYISSLLNGFMGLFGQAKYESDVKVQKSIDASYELKAESQHEAQQQINHSYELGNEVRATAEAQAYDALATGQSLVGEIRHDAEMQVGKAVATSGELRSSGVATAQAGIQHAHSVKVEVPPPPPPPRVSASLTASLQAAFAGILTLF